MIQSAQLFGHYLIYGEMAFVDWPDNGQSMPFSILVYDLPDYTSYESYAQIW